jgi:hypothetical protein
MSAAICGAASEEAKTRMSLLSIRATLAAIQLAESEDIVQ